MHAIQPAFKKLSLENGLRPWEIWTLQRALWSETKHGSGIWNLNLQFWIYHHFTGICPKFHRHLTMISPVSHQYLASISPVFHQYLASISPVFRHYFPAEPGNFIIVRIAVINRIRSGSRSGSGSEWFRDAAAEGRSEFWNEPGSSWGGKLYYL